MNNRSRQFRLSSDLASKTSSSLRRNLASYVRYVHEYQPAPFQLEWAEALMDWGKRRLAIVAPPESGKTAWCVAFCAWAIGNNPGIHIGYIANTHSQATSQSVAVRETVRANLRYRQAFPGVELDERRGTSEAEWFVKRPGSGDKDATFRAYGFAGPILGARLDLIILDDYSDGENTVSPNRRDKAWQWIQENALTRLNPDRGRLIAIQTRWAQDDIVGHLEKIDAEVLLYSAIQNGESLWPEQWTPAGLEERRREMGSRGFDLAYLGIVRPPEGNIFKKEWWRHYPAASGPPARRQIVISLDTAFKTGREHDYSVATVWALCDSGHYLLDMWRNRVAFPQLVKAVTNLAERWKPSDVLIEDAGSGQSLIQELRTSTRLKIVPVRPKGDKLERAHAVTPVFESGQVFLPEEAQWREELEYELEVFPLGEHDDIVDSVVQYLSWARGRTPGAHIGRIRYI